MKQFFIGCKYLKKKKNSNKLHDQAVSSPALMMVIFCVRKTDIKIELTKAQTDLRNKIIIKNKRFSSFIVLHCASHNRIS